MDHAIASQKSPSHRSGVVVPKLANSSTRLRLPSAAGVRTHTHPRLVHIERVMSEMAMLRRAPRLAQVAETAAFLASDRAGG